MQFPSRPLEGNPTGVVRPWWALVLLLSAACLLGVVTAQLPWLTLLGLAAMVGVGWVLWRPDDAPALVAWLLWANIPVVAMRDHGVPKTLAALYLFLLLLPIGKAVCWDRQPLRLPKGFAPLFLYVGFSILSAAFARQPDSAFAGAQELVLEGALVFGLTSLAIRSWQSLRRVTWGLMGAGVLMGGIALVQQATGSFDTDFAGFGMIDSGFGTGEMSTRGEVSQPRLAGPIGEKNRFGQIMLVLVALGVGLARAERRGWGKWLAYGAAGLSAIGSALTFSRGNAVAFALLVSVMGLLGVVRKKQLLWLLGAGVALLLLLPQYRSRLVTIPNVLLLVNETPTAEKPDGAILGRATEVIAALLVFADHPVLGVGPGQFASYSQEYGNPLGLRRLESEREAHTLFPHVAAEGGLLGLIPFTVLLWVLLAELYRRSRRQDDPEAAGLAGAYLLAVVAFLMCGIFLHMAFIRYYWFLLGVASAAATLAWRGLPARTSLRS